MTWKKPAMQLPTVPSAIIGPAWNGAVPLTPTMDVVTLHFNRGTMRVRYMLRTPDGSREDEVRAEDVSAKTFFENYALVPRPDVAVIRQALEAACRGGPTKEVLESAFRALGAMERQPM